MMLTLRAANRAILPVLWRDPKPARGKGVRRTGARSATHACGASSASGSNCFFCYPAFLREGSVGGVGPSSREAVRAYPGQARHRHTCSRFNHGPVPVTPVWVSKAPKINDLARTDLLLKS